MERLNWIEEHAKANAAFQIACADAMERQASALLNLLHIGVQLWFAFWAQLWLQSAVWNILTPRSSMHLAETRRSPRCAKYLPKLCRSGGATEFRGLA